MKTMKKHVVILREYERGWGSKDFHCTEFGSKADAEKEMARINARNTAPHAPDYYIQARYEEELDEATFFSINS
jgi:hypothetical protein